LKERFLLIVREGMWGDCGGEEEGEEGDGEEGGEEKEEEKEVEREDEGEMSSAGSGVRASERGRMSS